ncbi:LysR family transcriptional regulator ArgP [Azohydromonas aeria]|uniref:LysR family transcriptional regulator ArgP n=1 Tax=Azohydromonas aeria TaxID=2590212 RepID=UPI0012FBE375|nr:LysR family transcriptional regulator ArgP [Azohydromonas aeria]
MKDLDTSGLDCLAALADEGSFERAAQRLSLTQSAVSQRLRALESQLGRPLVVRSRPLRLTPAGQVLLRLARQWQALRVDAAAELGLPLPQLKVPIAVNADSLATWVLPALDALVAEEPALALELLVDDQEFTHEWLRDGAVLGCVSTQGEPLRGCVASALGLMPYGAFASPDFIRRRLPQGLHAGNLATTPFVVFNRKDQMSLRWVEAALGLRAPRLLERHVPSSEAYQRATVLGWGIGVLPLLQAREAVARGELLPLHPGLRLPVALYWHQWALAAPAGAPPLLDRIGQALAAQARQVLEPAPASASGE